MSEWHAIADRIRALEAAGDGLGGELEAIAEDIEDQADRQAEALSDRDYSIHENLHVVRRCAELNGWSCWTKVAVDALNRAIGSAARLPMYASTANPIHDECNGGEGR